MKIIDPLGNEVKEGKSMAFPLAFGQSIHGTVVKVQSGLGVGQDSIPQVLVGFVLPLSVSPTGHVGGVYVLEEPAPPVNLAA